MPIFNKKEAVILFLGDIVIFFGSLIIALLSRYHTFSPKIFEEHFAPFSILFLVWVLVFFIAGLYDTHTTILKGKLPSIVLNAQLANSIIAVLFFYFIPYFGITPKTNLFIYLSISFILVLFWRRYGYRLASYRKRENAIIVGTGEEAKALHEEINANPRYGLNVVSLIDLNASKEEALKEEIEKKVKEENAFFIIMDFRDERIAPFLPYFYRFIYAHIRFADMHLLYENTFDRLPLSLIKDRWILENITTYPKPVYDFLKRLTDILLGLFFGILTLPMYPFVWLALWLDDKGKLFVVQERIGRYGEPIKLVKFRSMSFNDRGEYSKQMQNKVTRVGLFLRRSRIDEFPQFWNIVKGDISFVGPRPELPEPAYRYGKEIPYYNIRHIIKPGLSGWAQICHEAHPHHAIAIQETKEKLSYDLYYIKNRSLTLDVKIILRTIRIMLLFAGK